MKIGIVGPISTESVESLLNDDISKLPKGYGGAPFLAILIKNLIKKGHQVSAFTTDTSLAPSQLQPICAEGHNFKIYYCPNRKRSLRPNNGYLGRIVDFYYREIKSLKIAIEIEQPEIVHAHWSYEFALAAIFSNRPYLITCHDSPLKVLKYMTSYYRFGRLLMALFVLKKAKHLSAVSPYLKNEITTFTKTKIAVVPNPTPVDDIQKVKDINYEIELTQPKIVMLLNWDKLKNAKPAIKAFNLLLKNKPASTLHIFGYGFEINGKAHQWAKEHKIANNVVFHGPTKHDQILKFLKNATFLLHPSLEECCPMTLIEAMSNGLPVIGGNTSGGVPWVLDHGNAGLLTDVTKPEEIYLTINKLLDDETLYQNLREKGLERINLLFSQNSVTKIYEEIYLNILKEEKPNNY